MFKLITSKRGVHDEVKQLKINLKVAFKKVKNEFSEHLETINQNTNEIQNNYEFLCELESRIEKLNQRVDEIQMFIEHQKVNGTFKAVPKPELTDNEQKVFMVLYTNEGSLLGYSDVAERLNMSEILVREYINNLIKKGVPIEKKYTDDKIVLSLQPEFKRLQATENILKINETLAQQFI